MCGHVVEPSRQPELPLPPTHDTNRKKAKLLRTFKLLQLHNLVLGQSRSRIRIHLQQTITPHITYATTAASSLW